MKILPVEQGSVEWMWARAGIPTASEFDRLFTPELELRKGDMPLSYLALKVAEAWNGPQQGFTSFATEQGTLLEPEGLHWYELEHGVKVHRVGFVTTNDGKVGCSPDGLIPSTDSGLDATHNAGLEIKSPNADTHVRYLLKGELPKEYRAQVYGSMFVTGLRMWQFLSYRRHFPPFLITVMRDGEIMDKLRTGLTWFVEEFERAMQRMEEINGTPRPKLVTPKHGETWARAQA